jgi:ATP-dependent helicase Lhr and Lhr-like helicase
MGSAPLSAFTPEVRAWFEASFEQPTRAQELGWPAIARREHTLLLAPTGSGKTLAAFLSALDGFVRDPAQRGMRVLYVSPLKALNHDIERNLRAPVAGIGFSRPPRIAV